MVSSEAGDGEVAGEDCMEVDQVLAGYCYMMPSKGRKRCRNLPPDVLSNLPDSVIDVILMCLPCKDDVRTSVLSKKWRYHWCRLTELMLYSSLWRTKKDITFPTEKFTKIIYQLLTLHEGPITKFTLSIKSCPNIDNFIYFLAEINAPKLRSFDVEGNISSICLKNVPVVLIYDDELDEVARRFPFDMDSVKRFHLLDIMMYESYSLFASFFLT
ncbi:hypothetical protein RND71_026700 [Anisodus tanguticus]|uniref:F-box domain-containing protein n=1 Tax=Anisodus tanguticus TaxID=243964 RepID=A0AAE1V8J4_9SOLA|nr:hypothetical protein RND71_026700 [Anisodus tanguticus]